MILGANCICEIVGGCVNTTPSYWNVTYLTNYGPIINCGVYYNNKTFTEFFIPFRTNVESQSNTSGSISTTYRQDMTLSQACTYSPTNYNNVSTTLTIYPNYGIVAFSGTNYTGSVTLNF
jgi:hypothetical protein